jgi:ABC-type dipeptide/oligopeptide/nickel transport system permease subunit
MIYIAPPFIWVIFAVVIIYLATFIYLWAYLKRAHYDTWVQLGSPSFLNNSPLNSIRSLKYLFGGTYKVLGDRYLTRLIWSIRALFFLCLALMLTAKLLGIGRP